MNYENAAKLISTEMKTDLIDSVQQNFDKLDTLVTTVSELVTEETDENIVDSLYELEDSLDPLSNIIEDIDIELNDEMFKKELKNINAQIKTLYDKAITIKNQLEM